MSEATRHDLGDDDLFRIAAEHFADRDIDGAALGLIWELLERKAMSATEIADEVDAQLTDVEAFLDWACEQELLISEHFRGDIHYSRYNLLGEQLAEGAESTRSSLNDTSTNARFNPVGIAVVVCGGSGLAFGVWRYLNETASSFEDEMVLVLGITLGSGILGGALCLVLLVSGPALLEKIADKLSRSRNFPL